MLMLRCEFRAIAAAELTVPQLRTLAHIKEGFVTNNELADALGVNVATMSRTIDGLSSRALVVRSEVAEDRRKVRLQLSEKGKAILQEIQSKASLRFSEKFARIGGAEQARILDGLLALERFLELEDFRGCADKGSGMAPAEIQNTQ